MQLRGSSNHPIPSTWMQNSIPTVHPHVHNDEYDLVFFHRVRTEACKYSNLCLAFSDELFRPNIRGLHELNIQYPVRGWPSLTGALCVWLNDEHEQFASPAILSLTFNASVWNVWSLKIWAAMWRLNKIKKTTPPSASVFLSLSLSHCPFINDIYSPLSPSWVLVECLEAL